jgi:DNA polymerase III alpha subunit
VKYDRFGNPYYTCRDLEKHLLKDPSSDIAHFAVVDPGEYNRSVREMCLDWPTLKTYTVDSSLSVEQFDATNQETWNMPESYQTLDIAKWALDQCGTQSQLQRVGEELLLFQERDLFPLLRFLKYMVDTFRQKQVVWGVGRGSSTASYVLYLIGVHRIDSMYYGLDIQEFLK